MIQPPPQRERCDHECMCKGLQVASNFKCPVDVGLWKKCKHDTRSRPHAPAPATSIKQCPCSDCPHEVDHIPCPMPGNCDQFKCSICVLHCSTPEEAARAATLAVQNDIPGFINTICTIDLTQYIENTRDAEDIRKCKGKDCNYCGKFNEPKLSTTTGDGEK